MNSPSDTSSQYEDDIPSALKGTMFDYPFDLEQFDEDLFLAEEEDVRLSMANHLDEACYYIMQYLRMVEWLPEDVRRQLIPSNYDLYTLSEVLHMADPLVCIFGDWWEREFAEQDGVEDRELAQRDDSYVQLNGEAVPNNHS